MKGVLVLLVVVGIWLSVASLLKRRGWTGIKRNLCAGLAAFVGLLVGASLVADAPDQSASTPTAAVAQKPRPVEDPAKAAEKKAADERADRDNKLKKLDKDIVSIHHMDLADPPRILITLKADGWGEASAFHSFASSAAALLKKSEKEYLLDEGHDVVFIMEVEVVAEDGDGMAKKSRSNILDLHLPAASRSDFLADTERPEASALLRLSKVEYRGRVGRKVVRAFCDSSWHQGASGISPSATFCRQARS